MHPTYPQKNTVNTEPPPWQPNLKAWRLVLHPTPNATCLVCVENLYPR